MYKTYIITCRCKITRMPVYSIEQIKIDAKTPVKCIIHCKVLKIIDLDTFVIGDSTGDIVLDTSKHPRLSKQIGNFDFLKIFAPVFENGKLITSSSTFLGNAYPIPIIRNPDLAHFVTSLSYNTVKEITNLKWPTIVHMKLKFLLKPTPVQCEYSFPVFANALDPDGDEIDVTMSPTSVKKILVRLTKTIPVNHKYIFSVIATAVDQFGDKVNVAMYAKTWEEVDIGQIYICHHLQIDKIKNKNLNHLRTLPITNIKHTDAF